MPRLRYNPYERRSLGNLSEAIGSGLSGATAYDIFSGIQGGALDRLAAARARRQDLLSMLPQMADFGFQAAQAGAPSELVSSAYGGFRSPMVQGALQSLLDSLYPTQATGQHVIGQGSPGFSDVNLVGPSGDALDQLARPAVSPYAQGTTAQALDASDLQTIDSTVATANPAMAKPGDGTHDNALQNIVTKLRILGYPDSEIQKAVAYFNTAWVNAGGAPPGR